MTGLVIFKYETWVETAFKANQKHRRKLGLPKGFILLCEEGQGRLIKIFHSVSVTYF